jgi:hypothetical protein
MVLSTELTARNNPGPAANAALGGADFLAALIGEQELKLGPGSAPQGAQAGSPHDK